MAEKIDAWRPLLMVAKKEGLIEVIKDIVDIPPESVVANYPQPQWSEYLGALGISILHRGPILEEFTKLAAKGDSAPDAGLNSLVAVCNVDLSAIIGTLDKDVDSLLKSRILDTTTAISELHNVVGVMEQEKKKINYRLDNYWNEAKSLTTGLHSRDLFTDPLKYIEDVQLEYNRANFNQRYLAKLLFQMRDISEFGIVDKAEGHGEVWWDINIQGFLVDLAFYDIPKLYLKRHEQALTSSHHEYAKNQYKVDLIFVTADIHSIELGAAEAQLPGDIAHQCDDKLKLGKKGADMLNQILSKNGNNSVVIPLLMLTGLKITLYIISRPWNDAFLFTKYKSAKLPATCNTMSDIGAIIDCAKLVLVTKAILKHTLDVLSNKNVKPGLCKVPVAISSYARERGQKRYHADEDESQTQTQHGNPQKSTKRDVVGSDLYTLDPSRFFILKSNSVIEFAQTTKFGSVVIKKTCGEALERELRAHILLLPHKFPNIISLLDVFGKQYMVFPCFPDTLRHVLHQLSYSGIANVMHQILSGLRDISKIGIMHMDINPNNIVYNKHTGRVNIIDFGLAQFVDSPTYVCGTDGYIAPELHKYFGCVGVCEAVSPAVDIFSAGVVFGKLLASSCSVSALRNFGDNNNIKDHEKIVESVICSLMVANSGDRILIALELLKKMVAKDPNRRILSEEALYHQYFNCLKTDPLFVNSTSRKANE